MIESYILMGKITEAAITAKEVYTLMPKNPRSLTLLGTVLTYSSSDKMKGKNHFEKALKLDPKCFEALVGLTQMYVKAEMLDKAITM